MKRDYIPTYRVEFRDNTIVTRQSARLYPLWSSWDVKRDGKPTPKNLEQWRVKQNESYALGGTNYHVSKDFGFIVHISSACIIRQRTGEIVASINAPSFEII